MAKNNLTNLLKQIRELPLKIDEKIVPVVEDDMIYNGIITPLSNYNNELKEISIGDDCGV